MSEKIKIESVKTRLGAVRAAAVDGVRRYCRYDILKAIGYSKDGGIPAKQTRLGVQITRPGRGGANVRLTMLTAQEVRALFEPPLRVKPLGKPYAERMRIVLADLFDGKAEQAELPAAPAEPMAEAETLEAKDMQTFSGEFGAVRTVVIDGEPWFVGKDVAAALGYENASKTLSDHVDDEDKLYNESLLGLGQRGGWLVNEGGLYSLVLSSKLPSAKKFKRWVTREVLPALRKTGAYTMPPSAPAITADPAVMTKIQGRIATANFMRDFMPGVRAGMVAAVTLAGIGQDAGIDNSGYMALLPGIENAGRMNASQLALKIQTTTSAADLKAARRVNDALCKMGLQLRDETLRCWVLTDKGRGHGEEVPFVSADTGHAGYRILWSESVVEPLRIMFEHGLA